MKKLIILLFSLLPFANFAATSTETVKYKRLICSPSQHPNIVVEIEFPKLINPLIPFIGFPQITSKVSVYNKKATWLYIREKVIIIPRTHPPGTDMSGQSSDALYLVLSPDIRNGVYQGSYQGQMFINDNESSQRVYFRFDHSEYGPGLVCHGET